MTNLPLDIEGIEKQPLEVAGFKQTQETIV